MKMIFVFSKTGSLKFIGHLDLMRAMQRALRRSGLPVRYSQGFNPHILLSFAAPLGLGIEGMREVMELPLQTEVPPEHFVSELNKNLPPLLRGLSARLVEDSHPALMASLRTARYRILPHEHAEELIAALPGFLQQESIHATRKGKKGMVDFDLKPLIFEISRSGGGFEALLALAESGTCKPDLLMQRLAAYAGLEQPPADVTRLALFAGDFVPLEEA